MKKLLATMVMTTVLIIGHAHADTVLVPHPTVQFDRFIGDPPSVNENMNVAPRRAAAYFSRDEGFSEQDLKQKYKKWTTIQNVKLDKNYSLLLFDVIEDNPNVSQGIHLISKNKSVGFCFIDALPIDLNTFSSEPILQQILALPVNSSYLQGEVQIPPNTTLTFYEIEHSTYVERYGILRLNNYPNEIFLVLDSFYPKILESTFKQHMVNRLNMELPNLGTRGMNL